MAKVRFSLDLDLCIDGFMYLWSVFSYFCYLHCAGAFGQVLECWDRETKEMVAIKVVRSIKKYREAAMIEVDVLQLLGKYDRNGSRWVYFSCHGYFFCFLAVVKWNLGQLLSGFILCSCVQIRNWFDYRNHICIVSICLIFYKMIPQLHQYFGG